MRVRFRRFLTGIHLVPGALVVNLKGSALQERTGGEPVDAVVLSGLLHDLDLSPDSGVGPSDGRTAAVLHIEGLGDRVQNVALSTFQLTHGISSVCQLLVDIAIGNPPLLLLS